MTYNMIFVYKGSCYESNPIKYYYINNEYYIGTIKYICITKRLPVFIHLFITTLFVLILCSLLYISKMTNEGTFGNHIINVPTEMYYSSSNRVLDVDISNDSSNFESIDITIRDKSNNVLLTFSNIEPSEAVGGVEIAYEFSKLPASCIIEYVMVSPNLLSKSVTLDVLIIDRDVASSDMNYDF